MKTLGLYIHVPFCATKCPYCDFYSSPYNTGDIKNYLAEIVSACENWGKQANEYIVDTIYFGGGTPSLLTPPQLSQIMRAVKANFNVRDISEITLEANPATVTLDKLQQYHRIGVNRLSLGMQSAVEGELKLLGRRHKTSHVEDAVRFAKQAGISNISLDVMVGISTQTKESLKKTMEFVASQDVTHVSGYLLKIEEGTPYFKQANSLNLPDEDYVSELYYELVELCEKNGFTQYEISNFAKQGMESKHNIKYWLLDEYLGLGPSAHSFFKGKRFFYERGAKSFLPSNFIFDSLGGDEEEKIMLNFRLSSGVELSELKKAFGSKYKKNAKPFINNLVENKDAKIADDCICLTPKGFLISNYIISEFLARREWN